MTTLYTPDGRKLAINPFEDPVTEYDHAFWDRIIEDFV